MMIATPVFATVINNNSATCDGNTLGVTSGSVRLRAKYAPETINLKWYDSDGNTTTTNTCTYDGGLTLPTQPTKSGYTFKGWKVVPYTPVEYVENASYTYLNTGIVPNQDNVVMEIKVRPSSGSWYIWQSRQPSSLALYGLCGAMANDTIGLCLSGGFDGAISDITRNVTHTYIVRGRFLNGNATLYVKDLTANQESTVADTYTYVQTTLPLWMFGNQNGNYIRAGNRVYYAKMWMGGNLVMDYEPGIKDGVAGFYDNVTKSFKTASAGSLIAAPVSGN